jgi:hypothetical protein
MADETPAWMTTTPAPAPAPQSKPKKATQPKKGWGFGKKGGAEKQKPAKAQDDDDDYMDFDLGLDEMDDLNAAIAAAKAEARGEEEEGFSDPPPKAKSAALEAPAGDASWTKDEKDDKPSWMDEGESGDADDQSADSEPQIAKKDKDDKPSWMTEGDDGNGDAAGAAGVDDAEQDKNRVKNNDDDAPSWMSNEGSGGAAREDSPQDEPKERDEFEPGWMDKPATPVVDKKTIADSEKGRKGKNGDDTDPGDDTPLACGNCCAFLRSSFNMVLILATIVGSATSFILLFALEECPVNGDDRTYKIIGCFVQFMIAVGLAYDFWGSRNDIEKYQKDDDEEEEEPKKKRRFKMPAFRRKKKIKTKMHYRLRGPWIILSPASAMFMLVYTGIDASECRHIPELPTFDFLMVVAWMANLYMAW